MVEKGTLIRNSAAARRFLYSLRQIGFDPVRIISAAPSLLRYWNGYRAFQRINKGDAIKISIVLGDDKSASSSADGHYFWQDLYCAKWIYQRRPKNHLDVGSRIDGFIANLLTFMDVTVLDVRESSANIPGLKFLVGNAQEALTNLEGQFESVSSLHSIEHFGLGRYGDPLDYEGHLKGISNIAKCVQLHGYLYVSFPVGKPRIEFNAQRIIHPNWAEEVLKNFELEECLIIPWVGEPKIASTTKSVEIDIEGQAVLYRFKRIV